MKRKDLIPILTPAERYTQSEAPLVAMPSGRHLFAVSDTNAGFFLITDDEGDLAPLDASTLGQVVQEALLYGVKLKNMRIFGKGSSIKRVPAGGRYYDLGRLPIGGAA